MFGTFAGIVSLSASAQAQTEAAPAAAPVRGCQADFECKGDRICTQGVCTEGPSGFESGSSSVTAKNSLYVSLLGQGFFYSINYERRFGDFAARAGLSYFSLGASIDDTSSSASLTIIPLTAQYLGLGGRNHKFEVGGGIIVARASAQANSDTFDLSDSAATAFLTANAGYRYQRPDGGFLFRAGIAPIITGGLFLPWPYISAGAAF